MHLSVCCCVACGSTALHRLGAVLFAVSSHEDSLVAVPSAAARGLLRHVHHQRVVVMNIAELDGHGSSGHIADPKTIIGKMVKRITDHSGFGSSLLGHHTDNVVDYRQCSNVLGRS